MTSTALGPERALAWQLIATPALSGALRDAEPGLEAVYNTADDLGHPPEQTQTVTDTAIREGFKRPS